MSRGNMITLLEGDYGTFIVAHDDGREFLVQSDFEYPGIASTFGWKGPKPWRGCHHRFTDGTIDCPECGKSASSMIVEARLYLDENIGKRVEDPGYFD